MNIFNEVQIHKELNFVEEDRMGWFLIHDYALRESADAVQALFSKMLIVRAESLFTIKAIRYEAYSPLFEKVPMGCDIPQYNITVSVHYHEDGSKVFSFTPRRIGAEKEKIRVVKITQERK